MQMKFSIKKRWGILSTLPLLILLLLFLALFTDHLYYANRIYPGVRIKNTELGVKTVLQAEEILRHLEMTFTGPEGKSVSLPLRSMGIFPATRQILASAHAFGRTNDWPKTYQERLLLKKEGASLSMPYRLDMDQLWYAMAELEKIFNKAPANAYFKLSADKQQAELISEQPGYQLQKDEFIQQLLQEISGSDIPLVMQLPVQPVQAEITAQSFRDKNTESLMSTFSTIFDPAKEDRTHNVKLAASFINNYFLAPGKVFSVNNIIGNTTSEKGYREASIIVSGELVPGYGGGICQMSTTLYNAALLANLEIIERHNHQLTVPYIAPGMDATISYLINDLKFRNNKDHYILITAHAENDTLVFSLIGQPLTERVEIETRKLDTYLPPLRYEFTSELAPDEEEEIPGYPGYLVEVWKSVYRGEEMVSREKISVDSYLPYPTIIRRGQK